MGFDKNPAPRCSVFYSLAPGLGKRGEMPVLRNDCRQLRGDFQCSADTFARTAEFQLRWVCQRTQITPLIRTVLSHRGALANVINAGRDAMDAGSARDERGLLAYGEVVWF
jgi:hypothetical protein